VGPPCFALLGNAEHGTAPLAGLARLLWPPKTPEPEQLIQTTRSIAAAAVIGQSVTEQRSPTEFNGIKP